jgi:hypothetical protein
MATNQQQVSKEQQGGSNTEIPAWAGPFGQQLLSQITTAFRAEVANLATKEEVDSKIQSAKKEVLQEMAEAVGAVQRTQQLEAQRSHWDVQSLINDSVLRPQALMQRVISVRRGKQQPADLDAASLKAALGDTVKAVRRMGTGMFAVDLSSSSVSSEQLLEQLRNSKPAWDLAVRFMNTTVEVQRMAAGKAVMEAARADNSMDLSFWVGFTRGRGMQLWVHQGKGASADSLDGWVPYPLWLHMPIGSTTYSNLGADKISAWAAEVLASAGAGPAAMDYAEDRKRANPPPHETPGFNGPNGKKTKSRIGSRGSSPPNSPPHSPRRNGGASGSGSRADNGGGGRGNGVAGEGRGHGGEGSNRGAGGGGRGGGRNHGGGGGRSGGRGRG